MSDTSIKNNLDNDESSGTNNYKWQKNNKFPPEKTSLDNAWKKGRSPQGI